MATEVKELTPVRVIHEQSFAVTLKVEYMRSNGTHGGGMLAYESDDGTVVICDELTRQFVFASPDQWRVKQKRDDAGHPK